MSTMASHITGLRLFTERFVQVQIKENISSASLAFVRGIHRWPVNSPHKWPVMRKMFPFNDVIMKSSDQWSSQQEAHLCGQRSHGNSSCGPVILKGTNIFRIHISLALITAELFPIQYFHIVLHEKVLLEYTKLSQFPNWIHRLSSSNWD